MEDHDTPPEKAPAKPIASLMGHDLRALGPLETIRMALIAWMVVLPWSLLFDPPPPEAVGSAFLAMLFHEAGVSLAKLSGWVILLGVLLVSRPLFAWILTLLVPGATPSG